MRSVSKSIQESSGSERLDQTDDPAEDDQGLEPDRAEDPLDQLGLGLRDGDRKIRADLVDVALQIRADLLQIELGRQRGEVEILSLAQVAGDGFRLRVGEARLLQVLDHLMRVERRQAHGSFSGAEPAALAFSAKA